MASPGVLGGLDAEDFNITADSRGRGVLTFASPPNFDSPGGSGAHRNQYLVTVQARGAQGKTGELPVTVTVTDQNEGAVVTGNQTIAVEENRDPTLPLDTYSASDPEGQPIIRWSLSGSDGGDFLISGDGKLTFRNTPDYDRPADSDRDNEYRVTVRAYDGRTYGNLDVTVTVSNVNEHDPVIRSGSRTSFTYREEGHLGPLHLPDHRRRQRRHDHLEHERKRRRPLRVQRPERSGVQGTARLRGSAGFRWGSCVQPHRRGDGQRRTKRQPVGDGNRY